jgi:molecular chaperone DnaK
MTASNVAIGIDFGTTNSLVVAYSQLTSEKTLCLDELQLPHPSVLWYRQNESPIVGREAKEQINRFTNAAGNRFIRSVKRLLGKNQPIEVFGENRTAGEIASDLFRFLKQEALERHNIDVREAVVTVPIYMSGAARRELRKAAENAGIFIKTFIHEPFAALYAYLIESGSNVLTGYQTTNCVVFDWGGGTLDVTVVRIKDGRIHELAISGIDDLAGDRFDEIIGQIATKKFCEQHGLQLEELQLSRRSTDVLASRAEQAKIELSSSEMSRVEVVNFASVNGKVLDLSVSISKADFEKSIEGEVEKAMNQVHQALRAADLVAEQIDLTLLVGGTSQIPLAAMRLRELFGSSIRTLSNASSLIAEGAAIVSSRGLVPEFASSVCLELCTGKEDQVLFPIFEAGHPTVPDECRTELEMFCTDPRSGRARLIIGTKCSIRETYERLKIVSVQVSPVLPRPYDQEGVQVKLFLDKDLVLNVEAWADTIGKKVLDEVVNLRYALPIEENIHGKV